MMSLKRQFTRFIMQRRRLEEPRHIRYQARCNQESAKSQEKVKVAQSRLGDPSSQAHRPYMHGIQASTLAQLQDAIEKDSTRMVAIGHVVVKEVM